MKRIRYNSWIANTFLTERFDTITIAAWVCTKCKNKEYMAQHVRNHECTHVRQWVECMITSGAVIWALVLFADISSWWFSFSFLMFYLLYGLEWLIKLPFFGKKAYNHISFEKEAYAHQYDNNYLENGDYFGWIQYILK